MNDAWSAYQQKRELEDEEFIAKFSSKRYPQPMTFTVVNPGNPADILKRRFLAAAERRRDQEDDLTWSIPDLPVDFGVGE